MTSEQGQFLVGAALALVALYLVASPLFRLTRAAKPAARPHARSPIVADMHREQPLRSASRAGAPSEVDRGMADKAAITEDVLEAAIRRAREQMKTCSACGPRPEIDAQFCSNCGRYLLAACPRCSTPVTEPDARFCTECGEYLPNAAGA